MRRQIKEAFRLGTPIYAECGGYQYLLREMAVEDGTHPMSGCLPGRTVMARRLEGIGYRAGRPATGAGGRPWLAEAGEVRGHVFHYGRSEAVKGRPAWRLSHADGSFEREDGVVGGAVLAGYLHVHFAVEHRLARWFLARCRAAGSRRRGT